MVGFSHRSQTEPIYREWIARMSDDDLHREVRARMFLLRTSIPFAYTEDLWKQECIEDELRGRRRVMKR
jgi:hypothetical protein